MDWIDGIVRKSKKITGAPKEIRLIETLLDYISANPQSSIPKNVQIAAAYDLGIAAVYYSNITNSGWLYCNDETPSLFLPFVNCCPTCALKEQYHFHKSSKPTSAIIGQATTRVLLLFYQALLQRKNCEIEVCRGVEPVDAVFIDRKKSTVLFSEIKSSPLLTPSLVCGSEAITDYDEKGNIIEIKHRPVTNSKIINQDIFMLIPKIINGRWAPNYFYLGKKENADDTEFAYNGLIDLIENDNRFMRDYLNYWNSSYQAYCKIDKSTQIFWLTNACGKPSDLPVDWKGGVTCISDEKTSVGMDRTDDIKKGIYQVLKIGSEGKTKQSVWNCKVGIISNIHPARHFESYLSSIKDLVWTISQETVRFAGDLESDWPLYNLFDGIITFTKTYVRDEWIQSNLKID